MTDGDQLRKKIILAVTNDIKTYSLLLVVNKEAIAAVGLVTMLLS